MQLLVGIQIGVVGELDQPNILSTKISTVSMRVCAGTGEPSTIEKTLCISLENSKPQERIRIHYEELVA